MNVSIPTPDELQDIFIRRLNLSPKEQETFLHPEYALGGLWKFHDMKKAVARIYKAVSSGETIGIYADYDCDGIPGAIVLVDFFIALGILDRVHVYIPDRHDEGYGMSTIGINALKEKGVSLIITVDLGITALDQVKYAKSTGIDTIVTDHHQPLPEFPQAIAIIHPHKSTYINAEPCGATVAFYLICAFLEIHREEFNIKPGTEKWMLDMVAFATLSDMVPLKGENRMLVIYGLMVMKKTRRVGMRSLFSATYINPDMLTETDLTFSIAPRLNAASRMKTPMLAFELLSTTEQSQAVVLIKELETINAERKTLVARIVKESHKKLGSRELPDIVVLGDLSWRPAVLGLVANKLQEVYNRSFFVWGESGNGIIKGSCRMLSTHHAACLFQALPTGVLLHAGGHQAAGGFAVAKEKIHFLESELNLAIEKVAFEPSALQTQEPVPLVLGAVTTRHLQKLRALAPFGVGNQPPLFLFKDVTVLSTKLFGKHKEHLEFEVRDTTGRATAFMFFVSDEYKNAIVPESTITFTGSVEAGWRGGARVRIEKVLTE